MSIPALHCPFVGAIVPSASSTARAKNSGGCCFHTFGGRGGSCPSGRSTPGRPEAAAEVSRRRRVGDALRAQRVEIALVVAQEFQVLQAIAAADHVIGDVQHVIALVVRQMNLQKVQVLIDRLDQADPAGQQMNAPERRRNRTRGCGRPPRSGCCQPRTSAADGRGTCGGGAFFRSAACVAATFDVYWSSLETPPCV